MLPKPISEGKVRSIGWVSEVAVIERSYCAPGVRRVWVLMMNWVPLRNWFEVSVPADWRMTICQAFTRFLFFLVGLRATNPSLRRLCCGTDEDLEETTERLNFWLTASSACMSPVWTRLRRLHVEQPTSSVLHPCCKAYDFITCKLYISNPTNPNVHVMLTLGRLLPFELICFTSKPLKESEACLESIWLWSGSYLLPPSLVRKIPRFAWKVWFTIIPWFETN